jgi:hypothetical protein
MPELFLFFLCCALVLYQSYSSSLYVVKAQYKEKSNKSGWYKTKAKRKEKRNISVRYKTKHKIKRRGITLV